MVDDAPPTLRSQRSPSSEPGVECKHPGARVKRYLGSTDTYTYCPDCMETWGGEETIVKKNLIRAAAMADVTELDEVEGRV